MGEQEDEEQDFKRVLQENKLMPAKKRLVIVCLLGIVALFILVMVNIRDTKGVLQLAPSSSWAPRPRPPSKPSPEARLDLDLSWCANAPAAAKNAIHLYLGSSQEFVDLNAVLRYSFSKQQLLTGELLDSPDCFPLRRFADLTRLLQADVSSPLQWKTTEFQKKSFARTRCSIPAACGLSSPYNVSISLKISKCGTVQ
jgi:hypothetical protein